MYVLKISSPYSKQKGQFYYSMSKASFFVSYHVPPRFHARTYFLNHFSDRYRKLSNCCIGLKFSAQAYLLTRNSNLKSVFYKNKRKYLASDCAINSGKVYRRIIRVRFLFLWYQYYYVKGKSTKIASLIQARISRREFVDDAIRISSELSERRGEQTSYAHTTQRTARTQRQCK